MVNLVEARVKHFLELGVLLVLEEGIEVVLAHAFQDEVVEALLLQDLPQAVGVSELLDPFLRVGPLQLIVSPLEPSPLQFDVGSMHKSELFMGIPLRVDDPVVVVAKCCESALGAAEDDVGGVLVRDHGGARVHIPLRIVSKDMRSFQLGKVVPEELFELVELLPIGSVLEGKEAWLQRLLLEEDLNLLDHLIILDNGLLMTLPAFGTFLGVFFPHNLVL
mmetsp:Transcript_10321/g.10300  ORF Transcript_10321/g.10300 Transcript_10321/m.10300 type:complete len:220 (+) Transcript_10321:1716-2375(+)